MNGPRSRAAFREAIAAALAAAPVVAGMRAALLLHIDGFAGLEDRLGFVEAEELANLVRTAIDARLTPDDACHACSIDETGLLVRRADLAGISSLAESLRRDLQGQTFTIRDQPLRISMTVALTPLLSAAADSADPADAADAALGQLVAEVRAASLKGGNTVISFGTATAPERSEQEEAHLAALTRRALVEDRMRLAFQSIASLEGGRHVHFDVQVRMVDDEGREWRASEFLPAAQKFNLMRSVDRWVAATALDIVQRRRGTRDAATLFIKLSEDTVRDAEAFMIWLRGLLDGQRLNATEVVFQAQEKVLQNHIRKARALTRELTELGAGIAIEHFGIGSNPRQMLDYIPAGFLKFHASYTQSFDDHEVQKRLGELLEAAKRHRMKTIVSHVEHADLMAKLWQMGIHFIQGYHVQEPEVVMLGEDAGVKR